MGEFMRRAEVARHAVLWLGTPYHHHARVRGAGVDCAMLLAEVYEAAGLVPHVPLTPASYPADWHLHHSRELFEEWLARYADPLPEGRAPQVGDLGCYRYGRARSHGAIVVEVPATGVPVLVHAYLGLGVIKTAANEPPLQGHAVRWWSVFERVRKEAQSRHGR